MLNQSVCSASCAVAVQVSPPLSITCGLQNHSAVFFGGTNATVEANCSSGGVQVACPVLNWTTGITGATLAPQQTAAGPSPRTSLFSVAASAAQQSGAINVACADASACSASCAVSVQVSPPLSITCGVRGHSPVFYPGESATLEANCTSGTSTACPALAWATNITGATLAPPQTSAGPSPQASLFTAPGSVAAPESGMARVSCLNPAECSADCNLSLNVTQVPSSMFCSLVNHATLFAPNDSALVQANCTTAANQSTACPILNWLTTIIGASFNPNPTPQAMSPVYTNFSTLNAPVPQNGTIDAATASPFVPAGFHCSNAALNVSVAEIGPDYTVSIMTFSPAVPLLGGQVNVSVTITNIGNQNATNFTNTTVTGAGCTPVSGIPLPPLNASDSVTQIGFTCTCLSVGFNSVTAETNPEPRRQYETNYANNKLTLSYFCRTAVTQMTCADFV